MASKKIRVLVVDDSLLFREALVKGLQQDASLEIVGTAEDPFSARDKIVELEPDVMTLDVEMPRMSGIEFLTKLMPQYPLPVVVVSSASNAVFDALKAGAVDFVAKPSSDPKSFQLFVQDLAFKIKIASTAKVGRKKSAPILTHSTREGQLHEKGVIAIGASTGGTEAIAAILTSLGPKMPGIVVTQHMPPVFTKMYAERLNQSCSLQVSEAHDGDIVQPGRVLLAPGDFQMELRRNKSGYYVHCYKGEKVSGHSPSVDVLFGSVAASAGKDALGVILTGMGSDGAKGLLTMKNNGAYTIGQDSKSSVVYGMPAVAYQMGAVQKQLSLTDIPKEILAWSYR